MTQVALNNLLTYLQGLQLTQRNRQWLAERLIVPEVSHKNKQIEEEWQEAMSELTSGKGVEYASSDDYFAQYL